MDSMRHSQDHSETRTRVLVVEDQEALQNSLCSTLEGEGYDVLSASNGVDALLICRTSSRPIDLLVTDYNMPQMTGLELARECARLNSELSVLYVSGSNPDDELRTDLEERKRGFLAKPFRRDELRRAAKELLLMESAEPWFQARHALGQAVSSSAIQRKS